MALDTPTIEGAAFDGFLHAKTPEHYLEAPATLNPSSYHQSYDLANQSYFDVSPLLNINDPVNLHFLVQTSIADSKGYKILSYQELEEAKKEAILLNSRVADLTVKLNMEHKLRDAASSLSKLHSNTNNGSSSAGGSPTTQRISFLFNSGNKEKKRLSKHAEEEIEVSNRKIQNIQADLTNLAHRVAEVEARIYKHNIGILALTHHGSESSTSQVFDSYSPGGTRIGSPSSSSLRRSVQAVQATGRMLHRTVAMSASDHSKELDGLIGLVSEALDDGNDVNTQAIAPQDKMDSLIQLVNSLVSEYSQLKHIEGDKRDLELTVHELMLRIDPTAELDYSNPHKLRRQLVDAVDRYQSASEIGDPSTDTRGRSLLKRQFEALTASYETNRAELERLELENVDLNTSLRNIKFNSQAEIQELKNELKASEERVGEWKERCETTRAELESVVKSLEDVTRQAIDYETDRSKLETTVHELEQKLFQATNSTLDKRVSMLATSGHDGLGMRPLNEPSSVSLLRHEFRKIIKDINAKHAKEIKQEQQEKKKLQSLLRSIKTSSYAATIPPGKLDALGLELGVEAN